MRGYVILALSTVILGTGVAYGENGFDMIRFIQYLDENTALEEVKKGNIDMYYWSIPSDRISDPESREGLKVYESTGGSFSILLNPAEADVFNPFSIKDIRFAVNYLLDRNLVVNELMDGYGAPMYAYYGQFDPEYISVIEDIESFNFRYNPEQARSMINTAMTAAGGVIEDGVWVVNGEPVEITAFIRSDDPTRKSLGELLAIELEEAGFVVYRDYGDLNKAFNVVYGSDPADMRWNLYTEGWGRTGFVRYDSTGLSQMYAPWYSNMPGFDNPAFWNYEHPRLDNVTQAIYTAEFESAEERVSLIKEALSHGADESVRIFLASTIDLYVVNEGVEGVINDFGAGIPSRFTPINARTEDGKLDVGVKQIYQGSWNPVGGLTDVYSKQIWLVLSDPSLFRHPYSGETIPVIADWDISTAGPRDALQVPPDAILWDPAEQTWYEVGDGAEATSAVTFHYTFGNWHHGIPMSMDDILYAVYFATEWGTREGESSRTFDPEYTPTAEQFANMLKGVRVIDSDTIEVYVDYWHFDEGEIAAWASLGIDMPWEVYYAMELAVIDGKTAFSRSAATSAEASWLSVIVPNDVEILQEYITRLAQSGAVPDALEGTSADADSRYHATEQWIVDTGHVAISNGPYVLEGYSPEARTITVTRNQDDAYPFAPDRWSVFENVSTPQITSIDIPDTVSGQFDIRLTVQDATSAKYFVTDSSGNMAISEEVSLSDGENTISIDSSNIDAGAASFKIFALSEDVMRPDLYSGEFFVIGMSQPDQVIEESEAPQDTEMPLVEVAEPDQVIEEGQMLSWAIIPAILGIIGIIAAVVYKKRKK